MHLNVIKYWKQITAALVAGYLLIAAYGNGYKKADDEWSLKWKKYHREMAEIRADEEKRMRDIQVELSKVNEVNENAQLQITNLEADNDILHGRVNSLLVESNRVAMLASRYSKDPAFADTGKTTKTSVDLLAELFEKSVRRNQQLANEADRYRIAGIACESAYWNVYEAINGARNPAP